ncbi:F-box domain-containing protein [Plectosphaerella plurivora]|uniref:F-box domain-containing protein n=1 Tax=Plectosphaerella plurivora TaxID=936078 RepID=A0A9P8VM05_9PEZI|nr:F-box domain-containing protein [Plectosphaerella plurivora]
MVFRPEPSAAESVLDRTELLELILLQLDMSTLLVSAQRVNTYWHSVIASSPALQQHLFFRPDERRRRASESAGHGIATTDFNPLLIAKFGRCFFDPQGVGIRQTAMSFYASMPLAAQVPLPTNAARNSRERPKTVEDLRHAAMRRFTRPGASWRRMLVSQPPLPPTLGYVRMEDNLYTPHVRVWNRPPSPTPEGLRMGHLYDLVQSEAAGSRTTSRSFRLLWSPQRHQMFGINADVFRELMTKTGVVLEVRHASYYVCSPDPENLARLNDMFRCDECKLHPLLSEVIGPKAVTGQLAGGSGGLVVAH